MQHGLGHVLLGRQVDLYKRGERKARHDRRLRADGREIVIEELELLFAQLD